MSYGEQPPQQPLPYRPALPTSSKATTSMILGIISILGCGLFLGIPAIIIGRGAKVEIRAAQGQLDGDTQATVGIVTGIIGTSLSLLAALLVLGVFIFGATVSSSFEESCRTVDSDGVVTTC